jgi:O-antigen ligase
MIVSDVFFQVLGFINGGKGSVKISTVTVCWPLCYIIIISSLDKEYLIKKIFKIIIFATWIIVFHTYYLFFSTLFKTTTLLSIIDVGLGFFFYNSFIEYSTYNIGTLIFSVPFVLTLWITRLNNEFFHEHTYFLICILLLGLVILSGRTIFQVNLLLLAFINMVTIKKYIKSNIIIIRSIFLILVFGLVSFMIVNLFYSIDMNVIILNIVNKFTSSNNTSLNIRVSQFKVMIDAWKERPLFGWGEGVGLTAIYGRQGWSYELVYVARLFQTGIIGTGLYFSFIVWIVYRCFVILKQKTYLSKITYCLLNGFICFMIANATNPYLAKFDFMWIIYLPLVIINYDLLNNKRLRYD